jgi:hypothetical protein
MHFSLANGEKLTPDTLQRLMALADDEKFQKASQRLAAVPFPLDAAAALAAAFVNEESHEHGWRIGQRCRRCVLPP